MLEFIAGLFSLLSVYLTAKNNKLCWPVGIVGIAAYMLIFYQNLLYADFIIQGIFVIQSIVGWVFWSSRSQSVKRLKLYEILIFINIFTIVTFFLYRISLYFGGESILIDSIISSLSIVAMIMLALKKIEAWVVWIIVDIMLMYLFFSKELYLSSFIYFIFLTLCIKGFLDWKKDMCMSSMNR